MTNLKIVILAGGWSAERDVSRKSGMAVSNALDRQKFDVAILDPSKDLSLLIRDKEQIDLVLNLLHGKYGEDGRIQGLLDILGIPFAGSGVLSSALALNKKISKQIYISQGLPVAKDVVLRRGMDFSVEEILNRLGKPCMVKPVAEGSSVGMSFCRTEQELAQGITHAFDYDREIIVESYIEGKEVTCCVLGSKILETLPLVEIQPSDAFRFFDYEAKYTHGATLEICPARLNRELTEKVKDYGRKAHRALGCDDWSRTDMIAQGEDIYVLETNTIPGMTENSLFPLAARSAGMSLSALVERLITLSLERSGQQA